MKVLGFGERKTPEPFVSACDRFVYMDVLRATDADTPEASGRATKLSAKALRQDARLLSMCRRGIEAASDDEGWAHLGAVGSHIAKQSPDFDPRSWGYAKLVDLITAIGLFEVERTSSGEGRGSQIRIREKSRR